ncbi:MAG: tRNA pseudouridine(55) synthase TruB, partial [Thermodesulfobacteriota bacterium]|nr:tRNA pseudouridine(55) synthase TruB [Thermodesulfobacteriota bacterium]
MNGIVIIDKPSGKTSYDIIRDVKRLVRVKKIGHTGTLDPLATGVLPLCINEATKLVRFFSDDDKTYRATMLLGLETDTLDIEGKVTARHRVNFGVGDIEKVAGEFVGEIEQTPPRYSAIKFKGKPLYKWARKGMPIDPAPRKVTIYGITIEDIALPYVTFEVACSKGTYIRSLCADIGSRLGCGACMSGLRRRKSGYFGEQSALSLENLDDKRRCEMIKESLIPMVDALPDYHSISVADEIAERIRKGYQPDFETLGVSEVSSLDRGDIIKLVTKEKKMV